MLAVPVNHGMTHRVPLTAIQALKQYNWLHFGFLIPEVHASPACPLSELLLISMVGEINLVL